MKKVFQFVFILLCFCLDSFGQNTIDKLMGQYSTIGSSTYSSIVKRDPNTRKVISVFNELKLNNNITSGMERFLEAFEREAKNATSHEKNIKGNHVNYLIRDEKQNQIRLYMMEYDRNNYGLSSNITISIIIKNKK